MILFFGVCLLPHSSCANYIRSCYRWCAILRKGARHQLSPVIEGYSTSKKERKKATQHTLPLKLHNTCWRYENVGEIVTLLLEVGENCHLHPLFFWFFHRLILSVSPTCRFHLRISCSPTSFFCFSYLQISPTCRFQLLADCIYLHLSCVVWLALSVFVYTIFSPTISFHPLCHTNQFQVLPRCFALWFHPLADPTYS